MLVAFSPGRRLADGEHLDELRVVDPTSFGHQAAAQIGYNAAAKAGRADEQEFEENLVQTGHCGQFRLPQSGCNAGFAPKSFMALRLVAFHAVDHPCLGGAQRQPIRNVVL